jgi:hypothetical protein
VAGFSSAIIVTIAFDHPSRAKFHLRGFVPERPVKRELLAESIFPSLTSFDLEILVDDRVISVLPQSQVFWRLED